MFVWGGFHAARAYRLFSSFDLNINNICRGKSVLLASYMNNRCNESLNTVMNDQLLKWEYCQYRLVPIVR